MSWCERCGKRRPTPHTVPMRRGIDALVCRDCYVRIRELFSIGARPRYGLLEELVQQGSEVRSSPPDGSGSRSRSIDPPGPSVG